MEAYLGLFGIAFLAGSLLPAYSEVVLLGLFASGYDPLALWAWASAGNILGAVLNYVLGRYLLHYRDRRWFPLRAAALERSQRWFERFGVWSLLFAWAPIVGDALTFIAGLMRTHFAVFLVLTGTGKCVRYALLLGVAEWIGSTFTA